MNSNGSCYPANWRRSITMDDVARGVSSPKPVTWSRKTLLSVVRVIAKRPRQWRDRGRKRSGVTVTLNLLERTDLIAIHRGVIKAAANGAYGVSEAGYDRVFG
jgi:hypothetical protein